jgi:hypothetical protein
MMAHVRWGGMAILLLGLAGCAGCPYSFTGASIPPHINTIAIPVFDDQSGFGDPQLRQELTTQVTQRFESDGKLRIAERNSADSILEGVITTVRDEISVVEGQADRASVRRVTISVRIAWQDVVNRQMLFERNLSNWGEYDVGAGGPAQRQAGIEEAVQKLSEDILLETIARW